jgi:hypothetical protein
MHTKFLCENLREMDHLGDLTRYIEEGNIKMDLMEKQGV